MVNEKILFVGVLVIILLGVIPLVIAVDDLISLQGNVKQSGVSLSSGNITVTIYDAFTGGNMVYNSTTDFNSAISSGEYDLVLGNSSNTLSLNYGQYYYMEIYVNNEKITYQDGATRQIFQSSVGNISVEDIDFSSKIVLTNQSSTFDAGKNLTMGVGGWFKGMFDWFIGTDSTQYLTFNGTTLTISSLANNTWTSTYNSTYAQWAYNQTYSGSTYNATYNIWSYNQSLSNTITQWLYNQTQSIYYYNQTATHLFYNMTDTRFYYNQSTHPLLVISDNNASWLSTYNATYNIWAYNQTYSGSTYNSTYAQWAYNQTLGGDQRFVNIDGDTMTNTLTVSSGGINITGDSNFGGNWQQGGTTISGGNIFTQVLYVVNITSLGVSNMNINGSMNPASGFNDTFDLGSSSLQWNDLYLGTGDLYLGGTGQKKWWYNQTQSIYYYNQTATHFFYNMTNTHFFYNMTDTRFYYNFSLSENQSIYNFTYHSFAYNQTIASGWTKIGTNVILATISDKVGIGTTSPTALLEVSGGNVDGITINSTGSPALRIQTSSTNSAARNWGFTTSYTSFGDFQIKESDAQGGDPVLVGTSRLTILSGGKVGIGTTTPTTILSIEDNNPQIVLNDSNNVEDIILGNVNGDLQIWNSSSATPLTLTQSGKLGIGTSSPSHTLNVVGSLNISNGNNEIKTENNGRELVITGQPGSASFQESPLHVNAWNAGAAERALFGVGYANIQKFKVDVEGDTEIAGILNVSGNRSFFLGNTSFGSSSVASHELNVVGSANITGDLFSPSIYDTSSQGLIFAMNFNNESIYNGLPLDSSGYNKHAIFVGINATHNATGGFNGGGAYQFNGMGSYIQAGEINLSSTDFSVSLWVKFNNIGGPLGRPYANRDDGGAFLGYDISQTNGVATISSNIDWGATGTSSVSTSKLNNIWYHVVTTIDRDGNMVLYVDGVVEDTDSISANSGVSLENPDKLTYIGSLSAVSTAPHNGSIDDVRIYNRALSPEEVKELYLKRNEVVNSYVSQRNVFVDSSGNVGIGTTTPTHTLNVVGTINATTDVCLSDGITCLSGAVNNTIYNFTYHSWAYNQTIASGWKKVGVDVILGSSLTDFVGIGVTTPSSPLTIGDYFGNLILLENDGLVGNAENWSIDVNEYGLQIVNLQSKAANISIYSNTGNVMIGSNLTIIGGGITTATLRFGTTTSTGLFEFEDAGVCIGDGGCTAPTTDGNLLLLGDLDIQGGDINTSTLNFGTATSTGTYNILDGSLCVGDGGSCTPPTTDGRLFVVNSINVGDTTPDDVAYNKFGSSGAPHAAMNDTGDVYIAHDLHVENTAYYASTTWTIGDIAENIDTKSSRENNFCDGDVGCYKKNTNDKLDFGDLVCIDPLEAHTIMKCTDANSPLAVGFISESYRISVGPFDGYPISLAGIVNAHVTNENGNVMPGDLLVSASKPGYAMKNDNPQDGTVVGKAFDFCDKKECKIPVFVALS